MNNEKAIKSKAIKESIKPSDMDALISEVMPKVYEYDGLNHISKNINVTITTEGKYCSGSCQFFDLNGPWCSLFSKEQQLSNDAISELLRCKQCLKTFGEEDSTTEEKNISKNINVTIKLDGEYCSPSCQFFIDGDFSAPLCALSGDELELTNGAEDILRCEQCLKTFGPADLEASTKINRGSLLSKSEYDPEEDIEFNDEDLEPYDDEEIEETKSEKELNDSEDIIFEMVVEVVKDAYTYIIEMAADDIDDILENWKQEKIEEGFDEMELERITESAIDYVDSKIKSILNK